MVKSFGVIIGLLCGLVLLGQQGQQNATQQKMLSNEVSARSNKVNNIGATSHLLTIRVKSSPGHACNTTTPFTVLTDDTFEVSHDGTNWFVPPLNQTSKQFLTEVPGSGYVYTEEVRLTGIYPWVRVFGALVDQVSCQFDAFYTGGVGSQIGPTSNALIFRAATQSVTTGVVNVPSVDVAGQTTHQLVVIPSDVAPNSCITGIINGVALAPTGWSGKIELEGSFDNQNWSPVGVPVTYAPSTNNGATLATAIPSYVGQGVFTYLRVNYLAGNTGTCRVDIWYIGSFGQYNPVQPNVDQLLFNAYLNAGGAVVSPVVATNGSSVHIFKTMISNAPANVCAGGADTVTVGGGASVGIALKASLDGQKFFDLGYLAGAVYRVNIVGGSSYIATRVYTGTYPYIQATIDAGSIPGQCALTMFYEGNSSPPTMNTIKDTELGFVEFSHDLSVAAKTTLGTVNAAGFGRVAVYGASITIAGTAPGQIYFCEPVGGAVLWQIGNLQANASYLLPTSPIPYFVGPLGLNVGVCYTNAAATNFGTLRFREE